MKQCEVSTIAARIRHAYPDIDVIISQTEGTNDWYLSIWTRDNKNYTMINTIQEWLIIGNALSVFCPERERI